MVTIKDIAKIAGVSHTTVSRALNDSPLIKEATKEKIRQLAASMDYVPNVSAKSLVSQRSYVISLFFSSINEGTSDSFLVEVIRAINSVLPKDYSLSVRGIDSVENGEFIHQQRCDGAIVMSQTDEDDQFIGLLLEKKIPTVVLNRQLKDPAIVNISADDAQGVREAIRFAYEQGYRKFGTISGKSEFRSARIRQHSFLNALTELGLTPEPAWLVSGDYSIESGREAAKKLLALPERPEILFCANDDMAIGVMNACHELGVAIPEEMAVIGFDDIPFSRYTSPPLTTVRKPVDQISQLGIMELVNLINGQVPAKNQVLLDTRLEIRDTTRK